MQSILRTIVVFVVAVGALGHAPRSAAAETLFPLAGEDAVPLGHGVAEAHFGFSYFRNQRFPAFTPRGALRSHEMFGLPQFGLRIGAGDWVEIQASYEFLRIDEELRNGTSNSSYGGGDARLFTKARLFAAAGPWPAVALRFGTKLPNAKLADRLGTDETDFQMETLFSRDFGRVAAHLNLGIAILGNGGPTVAGDTSFDTTGQDDPFIWSFSLVGEAHPAPFGDGWTWRPLGELRGMAASRFDNNGTSARLGLQAERYPWTAFGGGTVGIEGAAEDGGVILGGMYRFSPGAWFR